MNILQVFMVPCDTLPSLLIQSGHTVPEAKVIKADAGGISHQHMLKMNVETLFAF